MSSKILKMLSVLRKHCPRAVGATGHRVRDVRSREETKQRRPQEPAQCTVKCPRTAHVALKAQPSFPQEVEISEKHGGSTNYILSLCGTRAKN